MQAWVAAVVCSATGIQMLLLVMLGDVKKGQCFSSLYFEFKIFTQCLSFTDSFVSVRMILCG